MLTLLLQDCFKHKKTLRTAFEGFKSTQNNDEHRFFHPDYTVGTGIAPVHAPAARADYTAGQELHPALKTCSSDNILLYSPAVKSSFAVFLIFTQSMLTERGNGAKLTAQISATKERAHGRTLHHL